MALFLNYYKDGQLTSPDETVCVGQQVVLTCQQISTTSRWTVNLPTVALTNTA